MHSALALWMLGYPRAALDRGRRGMTLARDLAHPLSIANALPFLGAVQQLRGEVEEVHELADSTMELSAAHGLPQWLAIGRMLSGWVQAERGHGVAQLQSAVDDYRSKGKFDFWESYFLTLLAATFLKHGAIDDGLRTVMDAERSRPDRVADLQCRVSSAPGRAAARSRPRRRVANGSFLQPSSCYRRQSEREVMGAACRVEPRPPMATPRQAR